LLVIDGAHQAHAEHTVMDLPALLRPGDLVVVNDAATLPASLRVRAPSRREHELRFTAPGRAGSWWAVVFGEGDWRTPTESRPAPDVLVPGDVLVAAGDVALAVRRTSARPTRLVGLAPSISDAAMVSLLYAHGRPVQYSYMADDVALEHVQTPFAIHPVAVEMPSAARPLVWSVVERLAARGIELATITHAAGLSATGDPALDAELPLPEHYAIPEATVHAIARTRRRGGRVLAVGTSVVRALEGNVRDHGGALRPGAGLTDLRITAGHRPRIVDGLLSGCHEPGTSHYDVVSVFAPAPLVDAAHRHAAEQGYLIHEFGDSVLLLDESLSATRAA